MKSFKAAIGIGIRRASQRKQMGVATVLVILMVGVGVVAVSVGAMHTMRNTQERQLVAHAQVNAQAGAWAAVEAVRQVLGGLTADQLASLIKDKAWNITGTDGFTQSAIVRKVVAPVPPLEDYKITVEVSAIADAGQSSSTIEVVYSVTPGSAPGVVNLKGTLDFYNDLVMGGGITLNTPGSTGLNLNVDGDFDATSISIGGNGLQRVAVTGNLTIGSNVNAVELWGRNVSVTGGSYAKKVEAFGKPDGPGSVGSNNVGDTCCGAVIVTGGSGITHVKANGWVESGGGGIDQIDALRYVEIKRGGTTHGSIVAGGSVTNNSGGSITNFIKAVGNVTLSGTVDMSGGAVYTKGNLNVNGSNVNRVDAIGDVTATGGTLSNVHSGGSVVLNTVTTTSVRAVGNITCDASYKEYPLLSAGGSILQCIPSWITTPNPGHTPQQSIGMPNVDFELMRELSPFQMIRPDVNAWALESQANYAIKIQNNHLKVIVKNINNIPDGTYYIKAKVPTNTSNSQREYLCSSITNDGYCAATDIAGAFCSGQSIENSCFKYEAGEGGQRDKITIEGLRLPPGVVWVQGDLHIQNGVYYNTFIVTGNVTVGGALTVYSLNFASNYKENATHSERKNAVCKNEFASVEEEFKDQYPKNFCDNGIYKPQPIGNIGFLAGGIDPDSTSSGNDTYSGGNITLGSSTHMYGTVVAGNILKTGGSTTIAGLISAAGLQNDRSEENETGASTEVDLRDLPEGYDPGEIPDTSGGTGGGAAESRVLWTRYL